MEHGNPHPLNQERVSRVWPAKLSGLLDIDEHVNLAMGCGSNERIVRTTMDYLTYEVISKRPVGDFVAIIQWTQAHRFEYWDDHKECWIMAMPTGVTTSRQLDVRETKPMDDFKNIVYAHLSNETYAQRYWSQVVGLASFLEKYDIPYWFTNLNVDHYKFLGAWQQQYLINNVRWIKKDPYYLMGSMFRDRHDSGSGHPSELGHQEIAQSIYSHIKEEL